MVLRRWVLGGRAMGEDCKSTWQTSNGERLGSKLTLGLDRYVATEEGILELTVNIDERKQFPSMTLQ